MSAQIAGRSNVMAVAAIVTWGLVASFPLAQADDAGPVQSAAAEATKAEVVTEVLVSATRTVRELDCVPAPVFRAKKSRFTGFNVNDGSTEP